MSIHADLIDRVMSLPANERAELARQLIVSLEPDVTDAQADVDAAWETEIERRLGQVDRGEVELRDWRQSIERIRETLRRPKAE
jgi:putative addiction module component (TIGR02574 family)